MMKNIVLNYLKQRKKQRGNEFGIDDLYFVQSSNKVTPVIEFKTLDENRWRRFWAGKHCRGAPGRATCWRTGVWVPIGRGFACRGGVRASPCHCLSAASRRGRWTWRSTRCAAPKRTTAAAAKSGRHSASPRRRSGWRRRRRSRTASPSRRRWRSTPIAVRPWRLGGRRGTAKWWRPVRSTSSSGCATSEGRRRRPATPRWWWAAFAAPTPPDHPTVRRRSRPERGPARRRSSRRPNPRHTAVRRWRRRRPRSELTPGMDRFWRESLYSAKYVYAQLVLGICGTTNIKLVGLKPLMFEFKNFVKWREIKILATFMFSEGIL